VRLRALTEVNGKAWTSMAEFNVLGTATTSAAQWSKAAEVANGALRYSHPKLYQLDNGEIIAGFCTNEDEGNFKYKLVRSSDGGRNWSSRVEIASTAGNDIFEGSFLQTGSGAGTLLVAYGDGTTVKAKKSTDRGATWGSAITIEGSSGGEDAHPSLTRAANGDLVAVYGFGGDIAMRRSTDGTTWSSRSTVVTGGASLLRDPNVVTTETGKLLVAFTDATNKQIKVASSSDHGTSWSASPRRRPTSSMSSTTPTG